MWNLILGESEYIRLICQVYSPTETQDRALYIFSCVSNQKCSLQSKGWLVFRNQIPFNVNATECSSDFNNVSSIHNNSTNNNSTSKGGVQIKPHESVWSFLVNDASIGMSGDNGADDLAELTAMVEAASQTIAHAPSHKQQSKTIVVGNAEHSNSKWNDNLCASYWSAYKINEEFDEDDESSGIEASDVGASDERILAMYQSYLKDEDDYALVSKLPILGGQSIGCQLNAAASSDQNRKSLLEANDVLKCHQAETEEGDLRFHDSTESSAAYATEMLFQYKCTLQPHQVLRYTYHGAPMWCTAPAPADSLSIPHCELCGSQRVFEMQLMPALLSLPLNVSTSSGVSQPKTTDLDCVSDFDFGVVAVWSCPESCYRKNDQHGCHLYSEFVVVQPPSDVVHMRSTHMQDETCSFESDI